jgi:hypothetical protein
MMRQSQKRYLFWSSLMTAPRVSLSNYFTPVTHSQFVKYIEKVVTLLQDAHQAPCSVNISGLPVPKACVEALDDDPVAEEKLRYRLSHKLKTGAIGKAAWEAAQHDGHRVKVFIASDEDKTPFASVEFGGCLPKTATFSFFQASDEKVRKEMARSYRDKIRGPGCTSHEDNTQYSLAFA